MTCLWSPAIWGPGTQVQLDGKLMPGPIPPGGWSGYLTAPRCGRAAQTRTSRCHSLHTRPGARVAPLKEDWREGTAMVPTLSHFNLTLETSSSQPTVVPKDRGDELMRVMASPRLIFWLNLPAETSACYHGDLS